MSVLIKGMEMPTACVDGDWYGNCPMDRLWCAKRFAPEGITVGQIRKDQQDKIPTWCPLIKIRTPHGRLIDADAYCSEMRERQEASKNWEKELWDTDRNAVAIARAETAAFIEAALTLKSMPTIIEAEGGGEDG